MRGGYVRNCGFKLGRKDNPLHESIICQCLCYVPSQFQNRPSPSGQSTGIWLALSSDSGEFDPKWGPPGGALDFRVKKAVSGRKQKDFAILWFSTWSAFTGHCSLLLSIPDISKWVFLAVVVLYIVTSWNMPLFKVWNEDKVNNKFEVAENFA